MATTTLRRIQADLRDIKNEPSRNYYAEPVGDDLFEWHFTIRGPADTPFEGGCFHGKILPPTEYPFKPPNLIFLTEQGRWETGKKICLSISAHHPESWSPSWGIRLMLEAIISFMPTKGEGALAALDYTAEERRELARRSTTFRCPHCGPIKELLEKHAPPPQDGSGSGAEAPPSRYAAQIAQMHVHAIDKESPPEAAKAAVAAASASAPPPSSSTRGGGGANHSSSSGGDGTDSGSSSDSSSEVDGGRNPGRVRHAHAARRELTQRRLFPTAHPAPPGAQLPPRAQPYVVRTEGGAPAAARSAPAAQRPPPVQAPHAPAAPAAVAAAGAARPTPAGDTALTLLSYLLMSLIAALLYKRLGSAEEPALM